MQVKMSDATATSAMEGFSAALNDMPLVMRQHLPKGTDFWYTVRNS